ncbi:MAG: hypothetical protein WBI07_19235 [Mobilitalea sp.]
MGDIYRLLKMAVTVIIFCIGIYVLLMEGEAYYDTVELVKQSITEEVIYQQYMDTDMKEIITCGELIATLFQPLDYDIKIDSVTILKTDNSADKISSYGISADYSYQKSYHYDKNGEIQLIMYTPIIEG